MTDETDPAGNEPEAGRVSGVSPDSTNHPVLGALWMTAAMTSFTVMVVLIRIISDRLTAFDVAFYRALVGIALTLPFLLRGGLGEGLILLKTTRYGLYVARGLFTYLALVAYVYAVGHMILVDAIALNSTIPLFTVVLATLVLREKVGPRRWLATMAGFTGALIILRPGLVEIGLPAILALASAACYGVTGIVVKILSRTEPAVRIVFYTNLLLALFAIGPALIFGNPPGWGEALPLLGIGATANFAHFCMIRAFSAADASFVAPFDFVRLILVTFAGYFLFGETSSPWVWVGAVVIFASAIIITRIEARRGRNAHPKSAPRY
ncbi:MAG: DMT family transporter [Alphaproteobacteria bacterium]|nr:DMT family transporter [Alphaproteobacteria bacterium]